MKQALLVSCLTTVLSFSSFAQDIPAALGGETSRALSNRLAFAQPAKNIQQNHLRDFFFGNRLFNTNWVQEPASVSKFDGLGDHFNRVSCSGCHLRDGRGQATENPLALDKSMLVRLSVRLADGRVQKHPIYGGQLQEFATVGQVPEGKSAVIFEEITGSYPDGTPYSLRQPKLIISDLGYGDFGDNALFSLRVAPAVIGLGLLEALPEATILAAADPEDADGDGISGRPHWLKSIETGETVLGRFGWKANNASLREQNADAAFHDLGLTNPLFPKENCQRQPENCAKETAVDLEEIFLQKLTHYTSLLAVPKRRQVSDPQVQHGEKIFMNLGCASCHRVAMQTGNDENHLPELRQQWIYPFTDLLLHDMGEGLADDRPDQEATGQEWRTPPLWGIGLIKAVNDHQFLLHDGRARGVEEAILWHGGEAESIKEAFMNLPKAEREAIIAFVNSL